MKKKESILLILPKQSGTKEKDYSYIYTLGLGYISSTLKSVGYDVDCLNMNHLLGSSKEIINKTLDKKKYDYVGTGNVFTEFVFIKEVLDLVKSHKTRPKTILGGLIITSEPETVFKLVNPDYAVIGEGEETILELLDHLRENKDLKNVRGIVYRNKKNEIVITGLREPKNDINKIPYPDFDGFGFSEYLDHLHSNSHDYIYSVYDYPRVYPIMASRGCPFNCTFCYHYNKYRKRSVDNIMEELEINVRKYKANIVLFYDECIAANKERLVEICNRMKKFREDLPWDLKWFPQLTVHNIDDEILDIMKDSGVGGVSYGFESFSPTVLKSMNKPITPQMIENAFIKTLSRGLTIQANFIFGDIAETKETALETLNWWKKNANGQIHLLFIQPYPGSKIYNYALNKGIITDKEEFISNVVPFSKFNLTENMSDDDLSWLKKEVLEATAKYSKFVIPHSMKKIKKNVYDIKVNCPYCKKEVKYGNYLILNRLLHGRILPCRHCGYLFYIVSDIERFGYKNYTLFRSLRDFQKNIFRKLKISSNF